MKMEWMTVIENEPISLDTFKMVLSGDLVHLMTQPGQFLHVRVGDGATNTLRRPISIADLDYQAQQVTIIYKTIGEGTHWLSMRKPDERIHVLGPRGNGFTTEHVCNQDVLLIGGGVGVPPLYYLAKKLTQQNNRVTIILGFQTKAAMFYVKEFQGLGETIVMTEDGSAGQHGRVTDVLPKYQMKTDLYFTCGPTGMLQAVTQQMAKTPGYISLEERMGCGIGACFACVCQTTDQEDGKGYRKICMDGPVFAAEEVIL
ncbi:dihydroorotate dehydrogenase electron transfer subunit [Salinibacillus xinjiangensis]|uniref:Dihydroorotate dehydrogenase B (NAD(+)), electron transfer subunit n=1 Tax=Salinibacillus xinjiangensis TaxID=1229268 RepID=A0A6G1X3D1_9BACI|nr:dihydroorotate dehydrogenase electron transfer subunit [Salinibacillus xinjiangensis]MRG85464.1 dihydroorotate dehydrogenase electron transfer subunit [Salinibacillus xinjiangensis]